MEPFRCSRLGPLVLTRAHSDDELLLRPLSQWPRSVHIPSAASAERPQSSSGRRPRPLAPAPAPQKETRPRSVPPPSLALPWPAEEPHECHESDEEEPQLCTSPGVGGPQCLRRDEEYESLLAAQSASEARLSAADEALLLRVSISFNQRPLAMRPATAAAKLGCGGGGGSGAVTWRWHGADEGDGGGWRRPAASTAPARAMRSRTGSFGAEMSAATGRLRLSALSTVVAAQPARQLSQPADDISGEQLARPLAVARSTAATPRGGERRR